LEEVVRRNCDLQDLLSEGSLRTLVGGVAQLPTRPVVYTQLTEALADPDVDLSRVAKIVSRDVSLSAKVLHLTNSSFFGVGRKFVSVEQAVSFIGMRMLRKVVLSAEVFSAFSGKKSLGGLSLDGEQRHGLACAGLARAIAPNPELAEYAFLAGMMHDVGKLVLATRSPKTMRALSKRHTGRGSVPPELEEEVAGTNHGRIGAYLLGLWGLELPLVEAVAHHHSPAVCQSTTFDLPSIVHVADVFMHEASGTTEGEDTAAALDVEHLEALGVADRLEEWRHIAEELWQGASNDE
jgi:HD-like signal output (HDOD) protein